MARRDIVRLGVRGERYTRFREKTDSSNQGRVNKPISYFCFPLGMRIIYCMLGEIKDK